MSYKRFDPQDVVISAESVTSTIWSNSVTEQATFITSSTQVAGASGEYYYNVYQTASNDSTAAVQFSLAYADEKGSGSAYFNTAVTGSTPSSTVFGQYRSLVLANEESSFVFGDYSGSYFYAISVERARYKEKLLPGTLALTLKCPSNANERIVLTDNSNQVTTTTFSDAGRVYDLVTGSLGNVVTTGNFNNSSGYTKDGTYGSYGKFLPDVGLILLNASALDATGSLGGITLGTVRCNNANGANPGKIFNAVVDGASFKLNGEETISSNLVFVRARNAEFNYSSNPSNTSGSGELRHDVMINSPQSYITTVGIYNDNNDLLATAKLSKPLLKDFTKEALVRIKLDY